MFEEPASGTDRPADPTTPNSPAANRGGAWTQPPAGSMPQGWPPGPMPQGWPPAAPSQDWGQPHPRQGWAPPPGWSGQPVPPYGWPPQPASESSGVNVGAIVAVVAFLFFVIVVVPIIALLFLGGAIQAILSDIGNQL